MDPLFHQKVEPLFGQKVEPLFHQKVEPLFDQKVGPLFGKKVEPLFHQKVDHFLNMVGRVPLLSTPAATPDFRLKILGVSGPRKKCRKEGCPACGITCARRVEAVLPFFSGAVVAAFYVKKT